MMTFDPLDIDIALKNLKLASEISNVLRKKDSPTVPESTTSSSGGFMSSFGGIVRGIGSAMTTPKEGAYLKGMFMFGYFKYVLTLLKRV